MNYRSTNLGAFCYRKNFKAIISQQLSNYLEVNSKRAIWFQKETLNASSTLKCYKQMVGLSKYEKRLFKWGYFSGFEKSIWLR